MKKVSCGVLIYKFEKNVPFILLGHVTQFTNWDIFKGGLEIKNGSSETILNCAQRELKEESGLNIDESEFKELYHYPEYTKKKELWVFPIVGKNINSASLLCHSFVLGTNTPEFDRFSWFSYDEALLVVGDGLKKVIKDVFTRVKI